MAHLLKQRVLGVVENMSWLEFVAPDTGKEYRIELFGSGGGALVAEALSERLGYEVPLLSQVPFDEELLCGGRQRGSDCTGGARPPCLASPAAAGAGPRGPWPGSIWDGYCQSAQCDQVASGS